MDEGLLDPVLHRCSFGVMTTQRRNGRKAQRHWLRRYPPLGGQGGTPTESHILVMHRVIDIKDENSSEPLIITRGDSRMENDKPWPLHKLMGIAVSCKRNMTVYPVKTFVPVELRYKLCRMWLWVVCRVAGCH